MNGPLYSLDLVKEAARDLRFHLEKKRAEVELLPHVRTMLACRDFTQALVEELEPGDYAESVKLEPPMPGPYDVYGRGISPTLKRRFKLQKRCWYLKLQLLEPESELVGHSVFFLSVHVLEKDLQRRSGLLKAEVNP